MRGCNDCNLILDRDVKFCPQCGKYVAEGENGISGQTDQVVRLVEAVNEHRANREWNAALKAADQALKLSPSNPELILLLASVYEDRGMKDEAGVWYKMALDVDPANATAKSRLDSINSGSQAIERIGNGLLSKSGIRALVVAVFVGLLILTAAFLLSRKPVDTPRTSRPGERGKASSVGTSSTPFSSNPDNSAMRNRDLSGSNPIPATLRTSPEKEIRAKIASDNTVRGRLVNIDDVLADPRMGTLVVTYSLPVDAALNRNSILQSALAVARAAAESHDQVTAVTVRCVLVPGDAESTQIAFVGDAVRDQITKVGENASPEQILALFTNQWWNPRFQ